MASHPDPAGATPIDHPILLTGLYSTIDAKAYTDIYERLKVAEPTFEGAPNPEATTIAAKWNFTAEDVSDIGPILLTAFTFFGVGGGFTEDAEPQILQVLRWRKKKYQNMTLRTFKALTLEFKEAKNTAMTEENFNDVYISLSPAIQHIYAHKCLQLGGNPYGYHICERVPLTQALYVGWRHLRLALMHYWIEAKDYERGAPPKYEADGSKWKAWTEKLLSGQLDRDVSLKPKWHSIDAMDEWIAGKRLGSQRRSLDTISTVSTEDSETPLLKESGKEKLSISGVAGGQSAASTSSVSQVPTKTAGKKKMKLSKEEKEAVAEALRPESIERLAHVNRANLAKSDGR